MLKTFSLFLSSLLLLSCSQSPKKSVSPSPAAATPASTAGVGSGIHATASGLQYQVLKRGTGSISPTAADTVTVHYHGTTTNGTIFDSSVARGQPATFPLSGVIPGWTEGVQMMKVGDKFKFIIPPGLAYGPNSPTPEIPPNSTLIFDVELLAINGSTN